MKESSAQTFRPAARSLIIHLESEFASYSELDTIHCQYSSKLFPNGKWFDCKNPSLYNAASTEASKSMKLRNWSRIHNGSDADIRPLANPTTGDASVQRIAIRHLQRQSCQNLQSNSIHLTE